MKMLDTPHKKKSAGLTAVIGVLLLILFFLLGLTYYDPPISYGMEVNFGTLAEGSGKVQPQKKVQAIEKVEEKVVEVEEKVKSIDSVKDAEVEITFDPPWSQDLMSEEAKLELGML